MLSHTCLQASAETWFHQMQSLMPSFAKSYEIASLIETLFDTRQGKEWTTECKCS